MNTIILDFSRILKNQIILKSQNQFINLVYLLNFSIFADFIDIKIKKLIIHLV
ncbi:hypothetical protein [Mesomycoplasma ovipneumoniae]|uniref:hypothetical protein n=1 Tax=Mesomycoplasma ovipneumoniae TaxID=29562 RepID=UPI0004AD0FFD|nr:hypothetical protein [Mesomycoplasma ovipneumoniae]